MDMKRTTAVFILKRRVLSFTYERTPKQSIYSLEELFRHEFTHYLQGRYEVPGLFGSGELYQNERLTWFQEGNAEFFAGSTHVQIMLFHVKVL